MVAADGMYGVNGCACNHIYILANISYNLQSLDAALLDKLHGLDDGVLNPAIAAIVGTIMGAKGKTEDIFGPILSKLLSPFGLLKDKPEGQSTMKPDGTTKVEIKTTNSMKK